MSKEALIGERGDDGMFVDDVGAEANGTKAEPGTQMYFARENE